MGKRNISKNNILNALIFLKENVELSVSDGVSGNSIQKIGSGLEDYIKDLFSDTLKIKSKAVKKKAHFKVFAYEGNSNNPPDMILKNGDAIEVKKVDSLTASIQLNSSPPKACLLASDTRINKTCRELALKENWTQKDIFYAVCSVGKDKLLTRLWFIYGDCFAAEHGVYEKAAQRITGAISQSFDKTELSDTNELAVVPKIDPLGITRLRVRGMWIVKNPAVVFEDIIPKSRKDAMFRAYCLLLDSKYLSFPEESRLKFEAQLDDKMIMNKVQISDPNNPVKLIEARIISYEV